MYITDSAQTRNVPETLTSVDTFYPNINLVDLRQTMRLDGKVTEQRLRHAVDGAVNRVQGNLIEWRATQTAATLTDHQFDTYLRAIYAPSTPTPPPQYKRAWQATTARSMGAPEAMNSPPMPSNSCAMVTGPCEICRANHAPR